MLFHLREAVVLSISSEERSHQTDIETLKERLREFSYLGSALRVLHWDREVSMPKKGADARAESISLLSGPMYSRFLDRARKDQERRRRVRGLPGRTRFAGASARRAE